MRLAKDIVAGLGTIAFAIGVLVALSKIPRTSYQAIPPDLFARLCAYAIIAGGVVLIVRGIVRGGDAVKLPPWRAMFAVFAGVVAFGLVAPRYGYAPAGLLTLIIGGLGAPDLKLRQLLLMSAALIAFSVILFTYMLKLPMPFFIMPGFVS
ncbi:MAG: tripartite tricarboxylate transporter TctB family protein [Alphaproteobacteria bacterium]|nr:tripartite tricarboxylate transporter TctB family protein [Alphaproteobacteria bacterium]